MRVRFLLSRNTKLSSFVFKLHIQQIANILFFSYEKIIFNGSLPSISAINQYSTDKIGPSGAQLYFSLGYNNHLLQSSIIKTYLKQP